MLEYVEVTPEYQVYRRGKWHTARFHPTAETKEFSERRCSIPTAGHVYARHPRKKEAHIAEMESQAQNIIENMKQNTKKPDRYRLADISTSATDIPRSWRLAQAVKELGRTELKIYLDESGLSEIDNLPEMIAAAMK